VRSRAPGTRPWGRVVRLWHARRVAMPHTARHAAPLTRGAGERLRDCLPPSVPSFVPSTYAPVALQSWGDQILRSCAPENKGEPVLPVIGPRLQEVPIC